MCSEFLLIKMYLLHYWISFVKDGDFFIFAMLVHILVTHCYCHVKALHSVVGVLERY